MPTQEQLDFHWSQEINTCTFRENAGTKNNARDQNFCKDVTVQGKLVAASGIDVTGAVVVDGVSYQPSTLTSGLVTVKVLTENGVPVTVTGASGGVFDAGAY